MSGRTYRFVPFAAGESAFSRQPLNLFSGTAENDIDARETVLPWLLHFRKLHIALVIVHHAGRNGQMRGASRCEDSAAWVLRRDDALDVATVKHGAKFVTTFTKPSRPTPSEMLSFAREFSPDPTTGRCKTAEAISAKKGTVSKLAKRAEAAGRIAITHLKYRLLVGNETPEK